MPAAAQSCAQALAGDADRVDLNVTGPAGRTVPVSIFYPAAPGTYPLIAFSHGAFAAPERYEAMLRPFAAAGYVVVAPMHVDSELFDHGENAPPDPNAAWLTRTQDMALALSPPPAISSALATVGVTIDGETAIAMGHSYGALIAQLAGGAQYITEAGEPGIATVAGVDLVVAWSPPGPMPGRMEPAGWQSIAVPSLTLTGTTDILPGFIDDWRAHAVSYDNAPAGTGSLWVGEQIDHYFGGMFGRERPADTNSRRLFDRAMAQSLGFIEDRLGFASACSAGLAIEGESLVSN